METLLNRFQAQRMELLHLIMKLVCLKVTTIDDRIRLQDACTKQLDDAAAITSQTSAARVEWFSIFLQSHINCKQESSQNPSMDTNVFLFG